MQNARTAVLILLRDIARGKRSSFAIDAFLERQRMLSEKDRGLITELVYGILRWQGTLDAIIEKYSTTPFQKISPLILDILRMGIYQLIFLSKIPEYAALHETVALAKKSPERWHAGFVNAILRKIQNQKEFIQRKLFTEPEVEKLTPKQLSYITAHPLWMVQKWVSDFGMVTALHLCRTNNTVAPLTLRVNLRKKSRENIKQVLMEETPCDIKDTSFSPVGLLATGLKSLRTLKLFREGYFSIQDEASQLVGYALSPKKGESILDACAAPGGKSMHMAELMSDEGEVIALDRNEKKMTLLYQEIKRVDIHIVHGIVCDTLQYKPHKLFDRILLDAPCSSIGVLRRRPEAKGEKTMEMVKNLSDLQGRLLSHVSQLLKPDGVLLYSVCTFTPEETERVVRKFLTENKAMFRLESLKEYLPKATHCFVKDSGTFETHPISEGMDGFFMARFRKSALTN